MKKILVTFLAVLMLFSSVFSASAVREYLGGSDPTIDGMEVYPLFPFDGTLTGTPEYKQEFDKLIKVEAPKISEFLPVYKFHSLDPCEPLYYYDELYYHFSSTDEASPDSATPDFVLVECMLNFYSHSSTIELFGDYAVADIQTLYPDSLGYYIYIPETSEILTLRDAWNRNHEDIEIIFEKGIIGQLIGDVDNDGKLSVKDATAIQKDIAGLASIKHNDFSMVTGYEETDDGSLKETRETVSISDFNRDKTTNVKDATAIQKKIAGLEY